MWGQDRLRAGRQEIGKCNTRGGSRGTYITFASAMRIRQPTLALKPRGDVTRNPKQGYQWPQKWTCVRQKLFKKNKIFGVHSSRSRNFERGGEQETLNINHYTWQPSFYNHFYRLLGAHGPLGFPGSATGANIFLIIMVVHVEAATSTFFIQNYIDLVDKRQKLAKYKIQ